MRCVSFAPVVLVAVVACGGGAAETKPPSASDDPMLQMGADGSVPRTHPNCHYVAGDKCFTIVRDACKAAGCEEGPSCLQAESHPVQVSCTK